MSLGRARKLLIAGAVLILVGAAAAYYLRHEWGISRSDVLSLLPVTNPQDAIKGMRAPEGFELSVVAAEPDVAQPIGMAFDSRGRLWVAECRTYPLWSETKSDQVVIFADGDADGRFESRSLFCGGLANLSGLEVGLGGVWLLCSPNLLFIADRDGDGKPDGPAEVLLDGWDEHPTMPQHVANSLRWGPDGWLYGCLGCTSRSLVGVPGASADRRVALDAAVWRYHPLSRAFERVASGTFNPWGLDFDETGELFVSNNMLAHLWQILPGGRYERHGDYPPAQAEANFEWMSSCADHNHWNGTDADRPDEGKTKLAGGGHSHAGLLIYQGDNWPECYRGAACMCNVQGHRINFDLLERSQHEAVARHGGELLTVADPGYRGIDLECGPDGTVFVADWNARGSCRGSDTHASNPTGRIYRISHERPRAASIDLDLLPDEELIALHRHANAWFARRASLVLQDRSYRGALQANSRDLLSGLAREQSVSIPIRLRALWSWHVVTDATAPPPPDAADLRKILLHDPATEVRGWAIRLLAETRAAECLPRWIEMAAADRAPRVQRELILALHRLPAEDRLRLAAELLPQMSAQLPRNWQRLCWYAIEPLVGDRPLALAELDQQTSSPFVNFAIARRLSELWSYDSQAASRREAFDFLLDALPESAPDWRLATLQGLAEGLRANRSSPPRSWAKTHYRLALKASQQQADLVATISAQFGDAAGQDQRIAVARDRARAGADRLRALSDCLARPDPAVQRLILQLSGDPDSAVRTKAILGLATFDCDLSPLFSKYDQLTPQDQQSLIEAASGRSSHALQLLNQIESDLVPVGHVGATAARQLFALNDASISARLLKYWGSSGRASPDSSAEQQRVARLITPQALTRADPTRGREVFGRLCANCHGIGGQGGAIGPKLAGAQRNDSRRLIADVVDPSGVVAPQYRVTLIRTNDERVITGLVHDETPQAVTLQTASERVTLAKCNVESRRLLPESLMPTGLLSALGDYDVLNLFSYLLSADPSQ